jgi:hypothetical protein
MISARNLFRFALVVPLVLLTATVASAWSKEPPVAACFACFWEVCGTSGHWDDGDSGTRGGTKHSDCRDTSTGCHGTCGGGEEENTALIAAYDRNDLDALIAQLQAYPGKIHLNVSRQAIQLDGCAGDTKAHFPLTSAQLAVLQEGNGSIVR